MARRGENIYKRKDRRWEGRYIKGRRPDGRIIYGYVYGKTYGETKAKLLPLKYSYSRWAAGHAGFDGTVADWAVYCMEGILKSDIKQSTYAYYNGMLNNHILPRLGTEKLCSLTTGSIQGFVDTLSQENLGPGAVRGIFGLLSRFLKKAVEKGALLVDPCGDVNLPKKTKPKTAVLSDPEQKQLEQAALEDRHGLPILLALYTGMRIGEICALKWEDIDMETGIIHVQRNVQRIACENGDLKTMLIFGTPKSETSDRLIPLPPRLHTVLAESYIHSDGEYVVSCRNGLAEPRVVRYRYAQILKKAGIRHVHFHALRHTFATRCMELRFDVTTLSRILGHASVKMTLDIYTDSLLEHKIISMHMLDKLFPMGAAV